jgi:hypothetical protein
MNDSTHEELLQRVLDREATPQENDRLRELLASDPRLRARHADLENLFQMLEKAGQVDPPEAWKQQLLSSLRDRPSPAPAPAVTAARPWLGSLRRYASAPRAYVFAAGMLAGLVILLLLPRGSSLDRSNVSGTMLPGERLSKAPIVDEQTLELPAGGAVARTRAAGDLIGLEIELLAGEHARFEIRPVAESSLVGVERTTGGTFGIRASDTTVHVELQGRQSCRLMIRDGGTASKRLEMELWVGGASVRKTIRTHR